jgi:hypothetical protein
VIKIDRKIMDFGRDDSLERLIMVAPPQKPADGDMFWRTFPFDPEITNPESLDQILEPVVDSFHRMITLSPATA